MHQRIIISFFLGAPHRTKGATGIEQNSPSPPIYGTHMERLGRTVTLYTYSPDCITPEASINHMISRTTSSAALVETGPVQSNRPTNQVRKIRQNGRQTE